MGVGLGILIVGSLLLRKELMLGIIALAICLGVWELRRALAQVAIASRSSRASSARSA